MKNENKVMVIGDLHYGVRNDFRAFFHHQEKFNKDIFDIIRKFDIKHVFHTGDLFDRRKYINFNTLKTTREIFLDPMAEMCRNEGREFHLVPGNHDTFYRNTLEINSLSLNLKEYPFKVYTQPTEVQVGEYSILMLPWICDDNRQQTLDAIKASKSRYCFGHLELLGFEMDRGNVSVHGDDHTVFDKFDMVLTGHFHHRSKRENIHYIGSAYEFTWADYNDPKGVVTLDLKTEELTYHNNRHKIFKMYEYNDELYPTQIEHEIGSIQVKDYENSFVKIKVYKKTNPYLFDKLVEKIQSCNPAKLNIVDTSAIILDNVEIDMKEIEDTPSLIRSYVDGLVSTDNKDFSSVKTTLLSLYQDAITLENVE